MARSPFSPGAPRVAPRACDPVTVTLGAPALRASARAFVVFPALLVAACVSEPAPAPAPEDRPEPVVAPSAPSPGAGATAARTDPAVERERDAEFGRMLQSVDKRVDEFVSLGDQPGEEPRRRRDLERSAIEAIVAQHLDRFLAAVADEKEPTRRRVAARSLAFTPDPRATPLLVRALSDRSDTALQTGAGFAIARRRDVATPLAPLLDATRAEDSDVRVNSLLALWHVLDARADAGGPATLSSAERDAVLPVVETSLFDPENPMVRANAAAAMGALGDARGVDALLNLLRDKHPGVRMHVALALGKIGDRRAIGPLVEQIDDTPRGTARGAVILGISLLLEREGIAVPADMPDDERAWTGTIQRLLAPNR